MTKLLTIITPLLLLLFLSNCRKSTSIEITVHNYDIGENVPNAEVVIIERKQGGLLNSSAECKIISTATTDASGHCSFNRERLRIGKKYDYFMGVKSAYGVEQNLPCEGKASGFLKIGDSNEFTLATGKFKAEFILQINNMLTPSVAGDSLIVVCNNLGGGTFMLGGGWLDPNYPLPSQNPLISGPEKTEAGKKVIYIRKRKLGAVTFSIDTALVRPLETRTYVIDW